MSKKTELDFIDSGSFQLGDSMLTVPMNQHESTLREDQIDFSQSFLFQQNQYGSDEPSNDLGKEDKEETDKAECYRDNDKNGKLARLSDGSTLLIKKKQAKLLGKSFNDAMDGSIVDMESLHAKIEMRKRYKRTLGKPRIVSENNEPKMNYVWAEKYRPQKFLDLCSAGNDKQYRLIMHWLKKWSALVFGEQAIQNDECDRFGRPFRKILLIAGPSGIGKTSSALIMARHLGYNVKELNAANILDSIPQATSGIQPDKGSLSASLKLKILNALTTDSLDSYNKPNCLLIDEIDSAATSNDISKILNDIIKADKRAYQRKINKGSSLFSTNASEKSNKKKDVLLSRPIICIANDLYSNNARSLEKLRPLCEIVQFQKPGSTVKGAGYKGNSSKSVKDHLMWICNNENLDLDYQQINDAFETCGGDIRACINHLQFTGAKVSVLNSSGKQDQIKDAFISWYAMLNSFFKRNPKVSKEEDFQRLLNLVMSTGLRSGFGSNGYYDKIIKGCFSKYLDAVHLQDDSLIKPAIFSDWLYFYDFIEESQDTFYSGIVSLKAWSLFSDINPKAHLGDRLLIPNAKNLDFESFELTKQNKFIINSITDLLPITLKICLGHKFSKEDSISCLFLPMLSSMLDFKFPATQFSSMTETQQNILKKVARILYELQMKLEVTQNTNNNTTMLSYGPDIDSVVVFDTESPAFKRSQKVRETIFGMLKLEFEKIEMAKKAVKRTALQPVVHEDNKKQKQSDVDLLKGKYDVVVNSHSTPVKEEVTRIWVKYKEGYSNAVRRNKGWHDLWV